MKTENLTIGYKYTRYDQNSYQKSFAFGIMLGVFKGFTPDNWGRFQLSPTKECAINPESTDDFISVI